MIVADRVLGAAAGAHALVPADLLGRSRVLHVRHARMVAAYLLRELTGASYPAVGRALGLHHTSVLHACRRVRADVAGAGPMRAIVHAALARLAAHCE